MTARRPTPVEPARTPAQWYALLAGAFLGALGVLALAMAGPSFGDVRGGDEEEFLVWKVSGWNTVLWIAMGTLGVLAAAHLHSARAFGLAAAVVFGTLAAWGALTAGVETLGVFATGTPGNAMHALLAAVGLVVAALPSAARRPGGARRGRPSAGR